MIDSTPNPVSFPLNQDDTRPLPEIIADGGTDWEAFALSYQDVDGQRLYAVQDWIAGIAQTKRARKLWDDLKRRLSESQLSDSSGQSIYDQLMSQCHQLSYTASNGRKYQMDYAAPVALYLITQRLKAETGIRDKVLKFLAKAGVVVDEARVDPDSLMAKIVGTNPKRAIELAVEAYRRMGKPDDWIAVRYESIKTRKSFTTAFQNSLRKMPASAQFGKITNTMRPGLWKRDTDTLKAQMGLKENASLRDNMSRIGLIYELLAEGVSAHVLEQHINLEFHQATEIVLKNSELIGKQAEETGRALKIDIATNKPLIED